MPCTKSHLIATVNWFNNCLNRATSAETQVTMVVDLDELLITNGVLIRFQDKRKPEKFSTRIEGLFYERYYADSHAFLVLLGVQQRGHRIVVVTSGTYSFEVIQMLFERFGITLTQHDYHNRDNIVAIGLHPQEKAEYITAKSTLFSQQCMLFDDQKMNCPAGSCLFTHVDENHRFPDFKKLKCDALKSLLYDVPRSDPIFSRNLSDAELPVLFEGIDKIHPEMWQQLQQLFKGNEAREIFNPQDCTVITHSKTPFDTCCQLLIELIALRICKICREANDLVVKLKELKDSQKTTAEKIKDCLNIVKEYTATSFSNRMYTFFFRGNFEIDLVGKKIAPYVKVMNELASLLRSSNQLKAQMRAVF